MEKSTYTLQGGSRTATSHSALPYFHVLRGPAGASRYPYQHLYPSVRPVKGIAEQLAASGKVCAAFHNWEPIRHIWQSETMKYTGYINAYQEDNSDSLLTGMLLSLISRKQPDFLFLHLVETDEKGGHDHGWMSPEYLGQLGNALSCAQRIYQAAGNDYHIIITADHGGHDRSHGDNCPEDMTIPMFFCGRYFQHGRKLEHACLLDLAPTIAWLTGVRLSGNGKGISSSPLNPIKTGDCNTKGCCKIKQFAAALFFMHAQCWTS